MTDIAKSFDISLSLGSKHIRVLGRVNLVTWRGDGREHRLPFNWQSPDETEAWIEAQQAFWNERLDALE